MNKRLKAIIGAALILVTALLITSCKKEPSHYEQYNGEGYTVSVKYDANGGTFTTNTSVMCDSYNLSQFTPDENGMVKLPLIAPESSSRKLPLVAKNSGYFLAGWYTEREAVLDEEGNHLDYDGNIAEKSGKTPAYTYGGKWSFDGTLAVDTAKSYSADTPVITLYAAWVPEFIFNIYDKDGTLLKAHSINPTVDADLTLPSWNASTGKINMGDFPTVSGKTFSAAYLDAACENAISGATVTHTGVFTPDTAAFENNVMSIYVDFIDGNWYKIYSADQISKISDPSGHYELQADLDFENVSWPFATGVFRGSFIGGGHTVSNIKVTQSTASNNGGIFAKLESTATVSDVTFTNAVYELKSGAKSAGACFGLFAGTVADGATVSGVSLSGELKIYEGIQIKNPIIIGLVCGMGYDKTGIELSNISVSTYTDDKSFYVLSYTVSGNDVTVTQSNKPKA
ncbi:MAG: hypothetical protein IKA64_05760 [Clostridia bacterium]|nr:hypothetical protein [Clostridia bacterium]